MSEWLLLYLFTRLDSISNVSTMVVVVCAIVALWATIYAAMKRDIASIWDGRPEHHEYTSRMRASAAALRVVKPAVISGSIALAVAVVVPSKTDMAIIVGGKIALDASRTPEARKISQDVLDAIRNQLKKAKE